MKIGTIILISLTMLGAWLLSGVIISWMAPPLEARGQIGDMFGAINSLFSGFAFIAIIYTIYLQHQELKIQNSNNQLTQRLASLTSLLNIYSNDEQKYFATDKAKSDLAKDKKVKILTTIEILLSEIEK